MERESVPRGNNQQQTAGQQPVHCEFGLEGGNQTEQGPAGQPAQQERSGTEGKAHGLTVNEWGEAIASSIIVNSE